MPFLTLDLNTTLIISEITFIGSLCGMVPKSKVEIDLAFFLTLVFSYNWKRILHNPEFLTARIKEAFVMKTFQRIENQFEIFGYCVRQWLCAVVF